MSKKTMEMPKKAKKIEEQAPQQPKGLKWEKDAEFTLSGEQMQVIVNALELFMPDIQKYLLLQAAGAQLREVLKQGIADGKIEQVFE